MSISITARGLALAQAVLPILPSVQRGVGVEKRRETEATGQDNTPAPTGNAQSA
jgi:hypothetical protein